MIGYYVQLITKLELQKRAKEIEELATPRKEEHLKQ
jgi:hypothetical protein